MKWTPEKWYVMHCIEIYLFVLHSIRYRSFQAIFHCTVYIVNVILLYHDFARIDYFAVSSAPFIQTACTFTHKHPVRTHRMQSLKKTFTAEFFLQRQIKKNQEKDQSCAKMKFSSNVDMLS